MDEVVVTAKAIFAIWLVLDGVPQPVEVGHFEDQSSCQTTLDREAIGRGDTWSYPAGQPTEHRKIRRAYCARATAGSTENP